MLEIKNLMVAYGDRPVLIDISLNVEEGEIVLVAGPNGHGKSTLLKTICGLVKPLNGSVAYNSSPLHNYSVSKIVETGVIYIAEDKHLFPNMTVFENLRMGAFPHRARQHEAERLDYVQNLFPRLVERRENLAGSLSGGEARMLAIARGLMSNPKFLALDEPSLGLSPKIRSEVFAKIAEINEAGISILLVEQNFTQSVRLTDHIYMIENGTMVFEGNKDEALNNTAVREVYLGV